MYSICTGFRAGSAARNMIFDFIPTWHFARESAIVCTRCSFFICPANVRVGDTGEGRSGAVKNSQYKRVTDPITCVPGLNTFHPINVSYKPIWPSFHPLCAAYTKYLLSDSREKRCTYRYIKHAAVPSVMFVYIIHPINY